MPVKNIILVEGQDDRFVVIELATAHGLTPKIDFEVKEKIQGIEQLLRNLSYSLLEDKTLRYAVIVDADSDVLASWAKVRDRLERCGYQVPAEIEPGGVVVEGVDLPRVGVWLMPDNVNPGMLEHFLGQIVVEGDTLWPHAQQVVDSLPHRPFPASHEFKAKIHTWLAWQEEPGKPYGLALKSGNPDPHSPNATAFVTWLKRVFEPS